jgi:hypothetical protein
MKKIRLLLHARVLSIQDRYDWIRHYSKENEKVSRYTHEYKKLMNRLRYRSKRNTIFPHRNGIIDSQMKRLAKALKQENYTAKKSFVEAVCNFLDSEGRICSLFQIRLRIHEIIFDEIIAPVFVEEYKNENAKYIGWIGRCEQIINGKRRKSFFEQINATDAARDGFPSFCEYFYGKSFMIDNNQKVLDSLMQVLKMDILVHRVDCSGLVTNPDLYKELLKPFADRLERCKTYCKITGNDKWNKLLDDWELLVMHLYKYEEYVRISGYVNFNDYLEEIGVKILY